MTLDASTRPFRRAALLVVGVLLASLFAVTATLSTSSDSAQAAPGDPWDPNLPYVWVSQNSPTQLFSQVTDGNGVTSFTAEGPADIFTYNALAYDTASNYLYAIVTSGPSQNPPWLEQRAVIRIGQDGVVTRVGSSTVDPNAAGVSSPVVGFFTPSGEYWAGNNSYLQQVDLTTGGSIGPPVIYPAGSFTSTDLSEFGGYYWGLGESVLHRVTLSTGALDSFATPFPTNGSGAAWTYGNGNLGFSANATGEVFQISVTNPGSATPIITLIARGPGPANATNDGAASPGVSTDMAIVKSSPLALVPGGSSVSYELTVTNNGPGSSTGHTVSDVVPAALSNVASPTAGCSVSGETVTCVGGTLAVGESRTVTITADAPTSAPACFTNTGTVLGNQADPVAGNNSSSNEVCLEDPDLVLADTGAADVGTTLGVGGAALLAGMVVLFWRRRVQLTPVHHERHV